jgi:predicted HTH domain antitoxin
MTDTVCIDIPREVLHASRMSPLELKTELAVSLYQQGKLSFGKAREMAGMSAWEFQQYLGARKIGIHYDIEDYEKDLITLKDLKS